ncbi:MULTISPECIES: hypothetical protein [Legionella]|uniref:Uncharacterized protein n=2 Tax=Legionella TaxID=445 RepID=D3HTG4_LEGLN|nr:MULTISPECIES: hypothetical protein [Legionella]AUH72849.1 hypothetical protein CAB17_12980 [Legionella sainthelensi]CBJ12206.1 Hypothetical protein, weakly similar to eukaryotic proteins [Legionella longbeachae NSW150]
MECSACGYVRKVTDSLPEWQCPQCGIAYVKSECGLFWMSYFPTVKEIPESVNTAYIIINGEELYYFNRNNKFHPFSEGISINEPERIAVVSILAELKSVISINNKQQLLTKSLTKDQINIFRQILQRHIEIFTENLSKDQEVDNESEIDDKQSNLENNFLNRNLTAILFLLNTFFIVSWIVYLANNHSNSSINYKSQNVDSKIDTKISTTTSFRENKINLTNINLNKILNYSEAMSIFASDCKIYVQIYHKANENCQKAIKLGKEILPEFEKLDNEIKNKDLNELNYTDKQSINTIYYNLNKAANDINTTKLLLE